jgi:hypothetical protein
MPSKVVRRNDDAMKNKCPFPKKSPPWLVSHEPYANISASRKAQRRYAVQECDATMLNIAILPGKKYRTGGMGQFYINRTFTPNIPHEI